MGYSDHISGVLMGLLCVGLAGCKSDIEFSEAPFPSADKSEVRPIKSTIYAGIPIDLTEFQVEIDRAVPNRLLRIDKRLRRAACYERKGREICQSAYAVGSVTRDGAMKLIARNDGLLALIPIKADFSAKGSGRAAEASDAIIEHFALRIPFKVTLNESWQAKVSQVRIAIDGNLKSVKLFGREIAFDAVLRRKIKRLLHHLPRKLESLISAQSFQATVRKSWRRLFDPIQISSEPDIWLRGRPVSVSFGGFDGAGERLKIRIAFSTYLNTYFNERPVPLMPMPLPTLITDQQDKTDSQINMNLAISYDEFRRSIEKIMVHDPVNIGTEENEILVRASNPRLYASRRFLALQLFVQVDLGDEWFDREGYLYLTALPWFNAEKGTLTLNHVSITQPRTNPKFFRDGKFLFQSTPYTRWLSQAVHLDINARLEAMLDKANRMINRKIGKSLWLSGKLGEVGVNAISPREDHLQLDLKLRGTLLLSTTPSVNHRNRPTKLSAADAK